VLQQLSSETRLRQVRPCSRADADSGALRGSPVSPRLLRGQTRLSLPLSQAWVVPCVLVARRAASARSQWRRACWSGAIASWSLRGRQPLASRRACAPASAGQCADCVRLGALVLAVTGAERGRCWWTPVRVDPCA